MNDKSMIMTANYAAAYAVKLAGVQVVSAYPITPQSPVVEKLMEFIQKGEFSAEFVTVESEHSAITVCISASSVGARVFTASCANGLALMHEMLHWAAGSRLPIVMAIPNRAMAAPWSILNDQQDSISQRDTGWMQLYCRTAQEVFDTVIQAYKIAEQVLLPIMVCYDGFTLSHTMMPVEITTAQKVKAYLPDYVPHTILDPENSMNINPVTLADPRMDANGVMRPGYMDIRHKMQTAHLESFDVIESAGKEFGELFGRSYGIYDEYKCAGADIVVVTMGSLAGEVMDAVDLLEEEGIRAGVIHLRVYRPFPARIISEALKNTGCKGVAIMEKDVSYGYEGALASDLKAALFDFGADLFAHSYIMGLGGRDVNATDVKNSIMKSHSCISKPKNDRYRPQEWVNLKI